MAGGSFTAQNKVRPGVYINIRSTGEKGSQLSTRGRAALPLCLSYGPEKVPFEVTAESDFVSLLGCEIEDKELLLIREALKKAQTVILYRLNGAGKKAKAEISGITVSAKYAGTRGNKLSFTLTKNTEGEGEFLLAVYMDGKLAESKAGSSFAEFSSRFLTFAEGAEVQSCSLTFLEGGEDSIAEKSDYSNFFKAMECCSFQAMALPTGDEEIKGMAVSFVKRMREKEGKLFQLVLPDSQADYEGVISVKNGVVLADGTEIDRAKATAYVAGMTAGAEINESNTYKAYEGAIDALPRYLNSEIVQYLGEGQLLFTEREGKAIVEQDINTFCSVSAEKGKDFSKNRVIRVLDSLSADIRRIFEEQYLGMGNTPEGRNLLKGALIRYFEELRGLGAIQDFDAGSDIVVLEGSSSDSVLISLAVKPADSMEKLYITVTI